MTDSDRSSTASADGKPSRACSICGVPLGKFGIRHSKKHTCHTCNSLVCALCSQHFLPDSVTGKAARACKSCWDKVSGDTRTLQMEIERLEALLLETEQNNEAAIILLKSEASTHLLAIATLKSELETCKAEKTEQERLVKLGEETAALLEKEEAISAALRGQLAEREKQFECAENDHSAKIKEILREHEESLSLLNKALEESNKSSQKAKGGKESWKQQAGLHQTTLQQKEIEVRTLVEEKAKLLSSLEQLKEGEEKLKWSLQELTQKEEIRSSRETELQQTLHNLSVLHAATEAQLNSLLGQTLPDLQAQVQRLTSDLESTQIALRSREREKAQAEFQVDETRKRSEALSLELSQLKRPTQSSNPLPPDACLRCAIM